MDTMISNAKMEHCYKPISAICEQDRQEVRFDRLVKLWVDDKISYSMLLENYPDYELSMIRKILKHLGAIIG